MPKNLFYELDEEKKARIIEVSLNEFAENTYNESSTNRIVKNAGIGKGSLFKYFSGKEDLYFYLLDYIISDLVEKLKEDLLNLPEDLFERAIKYSELEFTWYVKNPSQYRLLKKAFVDDNSEIYKKTEEKYEVMGEAFYYKLFDDINTEHFIWDKKKTLDVLKWVLKGFNEEFIKEIEQEGGIDAVKDKYIKLLKEYLVILKKGLCR